MDRKELVFIGLGRMGAAMSTHLVEQGYMVHGFDVSEMARKTAADTGVTTYESIADALAAMAEPKVVWLMVPSKFNDDVLAEIYPCLQAGDTIIDGGNTFYKDTLRRAADAREKDIHYVDCGTSGGMDGARNGASLMVGGNREAVETHRHIFEALAAKDGFGHVGDTGAGHYVKMIHNGIEYGMMGAIAEGMNVLEERKTEFSINIAEALKAYEHESIITSKLATWMGDSYRTDGYLDSIAGEVPRGETEAEMEDIVANNNTPVLAAALQQRKDTRKNPSRIGTLISAMRNQFGGHKTIQK